MVIKRLPVKTGDGIGFRELQARLHEVGRIRIGIFNPDKGGRGAPEKLDRFRLTSPQRALIEAVAELYGGEPREFVPQKSKIAQWEVITETNELPVYIVPQQIDPWLESWGAGGCIRRCDGETARVREQGQEVVRACPCAAGDVAERDVCKPTARVQLELAEVPAIGTWRLETHGDTFAREVTALADYVNRFPVAVPAMLFLEARRAQPLVNGKRMTSTVYVPHLLISVATPRQFAIGGDTLSRAIEASTGTPVPMLEASAAEESGRPELTTGEGPVTPPAPEPVAVEPPAPKVVGGVVQDPAMRAAILRDIEACATPGDIDNLKAKLKSRGVGREDTQIVEAAGSKRAALVAAGEMEAARDTGRRNSLLGDPDRLKAHHQHLKDVRPEHREAPGTELEPPEPKYHLGDVVEVGGIAFTKVSDGATIEDVFGTPPPDEPPADWPPVLDAEEVPADTSGTVYDLETELNRIYTAAGKHRLTTARTREMIGTATGVARNSEIGQQHAGFLHALANGLEDGSIIG